MNQTTGMKTDDVEAQLGQPLRSTGLTWSTIRRRALGVPGRSNGIVFVTQSRSERSSPPRSRSSTATRCPALSSTRRTARLKPSPLDSRRPGDELITHYPGLQAQRDSLPLLHLWQETFGHISPQGIEWIAQKLELQPINILELVTFYPMFRQHPIGRIQIKVCRTLSCALSGQLRAVRSSAAHVRHAVEPDAHGIASSPDGKYAVEFVECIASCGTAPVIMINDDLHEAVTVPRADELLAKYE